MTGRAIAGNPLRHLGYFVEWGGRNWQRLLTAAFDEFMGHDLEGQRVLDIGTRYGKAACLFALLGAQVVGIDLDQRDLAIAQQEAEHWGVAHRVDFIAYDGNLDLFCDQAFDLVFTKSVLVVVPQLPAFLRQIEAKLKPGGKIVFLENGRGSMPVHALRALRHRR